MSNVITLVGHSVPQVTLEQAVQHYLSRKRMRGAQLNTLYWAQGFDDALVVPDFVRGR